MKEYSQYFMFAIHVKESKVFACNRSKYIAPYTITSTYIFIHFSNIILLSALQLRPEFLQNEGNLATLQNQPHNHFSRSFLSDSF